MTNLEQLINVSHLFGRNKEYVIAGGGNTSFKDEHSIWVKASGTSLADIDEDGFVCLSRNLLKQIATSTYSSNAQEREEQVKNDLYKAIISTNGKRPSVETSMHEVIDYAFVVHTHPTLINSLMCSVKSEEVACDLFPEMSIYVGYTDPGYVLFKKVDDAIRLFKQRNKYCPKIIFLQNHGVFVASDSIDEIISIYEKLANVLLAKLSESLPDLILYSENCEMATKIINEKFKKSVVYQSDNLTKQFIQSDKSFAKVASPFTPDQIVYCKSNYLFVESEDQLVKAIESFVTINNYLPKIIAIKGKALFAMEDSEKSAQIAIDVFTDGMKIAYLSMSFGGPHAMTAEQISFIDNWEVENYRRKVAKS